MNALHIKGLKLFIYSLRVNLSCLTVENVSMMSRAQYLQ